MSVNSPRAAGPCLSLAVSLLLAACAGRPAMPADQAQQSALMALKAGAIKLPCGKSCADVWKQEAPSLRRLDHDEKWEELAARVGAIGYHSDLAYYYLGQSAQGLGFHEAAILYYTRALTVAGTEAGLGVLNAVPVLIQASRDALAQTVRASN